MVATEQYQQTCREWGFTPVRLKLRKQLSAERVWNSTQVQQEASPLDSSETNEEELKNALELVWNRMGSEIVRIIITNNGGVLIEKHEIVKKRFTLG